MPPSDFFFASFVTLICPLLSGRGERPKAPIERPFVSGGGQRHEQPGPLRDLIPLRRACRNVFARHSGCNVAIHAARLENRARCDAITVA
jgi:hypothetical protein